MFFIYLYINNINTKIEKRNICFNDLAGSF